MRAIDDRIWRFGLGRTAGRRGLPRALSRVVTAMVLLVVLASSAAAARPKWQMVPSPSVGDMRTWLADVAAISSTDAWAVGGYFDAARSVDQTLIERWDGTAWTIAEHPAVGGGYRSFSAASASGTDDVWAVGSFHPTRFSTEQSLAMHWDGNSWTRVPVPGRPQWDGIADVSARAPDDAWAVGNSYTGSFIIHWDGVAWALVDHPNVGWIQAVHARAANDVWAVGQQTLSGPEGGVYATLAMHWDGSGWSVIPSPNTGRDFNFLQGVHGSAQYDVWAVGAAWDSTQPMRTLALHWNGVAWSIVPTPVTGEDSQLIDVAIQPATGAWAVGTVDGRTLIERWDGVTWRPFPSPSPGTDDALGAISTDPQGRSWAVGTSHQGSGWVSLALRSPPG